MSSENNSSVINKETLDMYLKELAKEYKKMVGRNIPAELILIGGAAIIEKYGFRDMTTDIDAIINAASAMKDAINIVGDRNGLPVGWLNDDFRKTASYTDKLMYFSKYYRTFYQVLNVRIVCGEYLIAMKLRSFRQYKNDISDIVGILNEHQKQGREITRQNIDKAVYDLYGSWDGFSPEAVAFIDEILKTKDYSETYEKVSANEKSIKRKLLEFQEEYPNVLKQDNLNDIINSLKDGTRKKQ